LNEEDSAENRGDKDVDMAMNEENLPPLEPVIEVASPKVWSKKKNETKVGSNNGRGAFQDSGNVEKVILVHDIKKLARGASRVKESNMKGGMGKENVSLRDISNCKGNE
jgi:hypothetical protein